MVAKTQFVESRMKILETGVCRREMAEHFHLPAVDGTHEDATVRAIINLDLTGMIENVDRTVLCAEGLIRKEVDDHCRTLTSQFWTEKGRRIEWGRLDRCELTDELLPIDGAWQTIDGLVLEFIENEVFFLDRFAIFSFPGKWDEESMHAIDRER